MANHTNQLVIHISPEVLSVALVKKGRVIQTESTVMRITDWQGLWDDGLMRLDQPVRQLLSRFGTKRFPPATVLYHSPSVTQQVFTSEVSVEHAREVGEVKIRESVGFANPVESSILNNSTGTGGGVTSLIYSDSEEHLRSLYAWLNRCGLSSRAFIPTSVAVIETAAEIASQAEPEAAVFYIGADVSVMAFQNESGLQLIRSVEIGYQKLVEGYKVGLDAARKDRGIEIDGCEPDQSDQIAIENDLCEAFSYLFKYGIPFQPQDVGGVDLRESILPLVAPVLQRFCIEVKQTFRFGLSGKAMPKYLTICGPGSSIPSISKAISQHVEMHIQCAKDSGQIEPGKAFGHGSIEHAIASAGTCHSGLLPDIARDALDRSVLNKGLVAGVALAALALGGEYVHTSIESNKLMDAISKNAPRLATVKKFEGQTTSIDTMSGLIIDVSTLVNETVDGIPDWYSTLVGISALTSDTIRVQELRGEYGQENAVIEINGYAVDGTGDGSGQTLNQFITALDSLESVSTVTLGATTRISVGDDQWGRQFTMKIELESAPLPHAAIADMASEEIEWGTP